MGFQGGGEVSVDNVTIEKDISGDLKVIDGGIGALQLANSWKLLDSGNWTNDTAMATITSIAAKKVLMLVFETLDLTGANNQIKLTINNDTGGNYEWSQFSGTTLFNFTGHTSMTTGYVRPNKSAVMGLILHSPQDVRHLMEILFGGTSIGGGGSNQRDYMLGGLHLGAAVITRLDLFAASNTTGKWALYYNEDVE